MSGSIGLSDRIQVSPKFMEKDVKRRALPAESRMGLVKFLVV